ncbi:MAG: hypothetical protein WCS71_09025 [Sphaerochaetaceae bacterium]
MFWIPMLAAGAMSAGKAALDNKDKQDQAKRENKAREKVDLRNLADAAQQVGSLGMLAGEYRRQATETRISAQREIGKARGTAEAQAGAAGIKGASVDAVFDDLDREFGEAEVAIDRDLENKQYNLGEQLRSLQLSTANGLLGQINPKAGLKNPLMEGLMTMGSMYADSYFKFGAQKGG